jgi:hypothetical protein
MVNGGLFVLTQSRQFRFHKGDNEWLMKEKIDHVKAAEKLEVKPGNLGGIGRSDGICIRCKSCL